MSQKTKEIKQSNCAGAADGPLSDMVVIEFAHGLAGPFAGTLLADFGAQVVKVERPGEGDVMRQWDYSGGTWWRSISRNKRSIAIDLSHPESQEVLKDLVQRADVVIESFRPGVMERLGLGPSTLKEWNPSVTILRVSGYGQTGPYRERPGYGKAAEAFAGLLHMTGFPDGPPVFVGFPIADMTSGLMGAFGVLLAWIARKNGLEDGQVVDLALYETILRVMDYTIPMATGSSVPLNRSGNRQPMNFAPSGVFRTLDERWVLYSAASAEIVQRVLSVVAGAEIAAEPRFASLRTIRDHTEEIDSLVAKYCITRSGNEVVQRFTEAHAVAALVSTPAEVAIDPHVLARRSVTSVGTDPTKYVNVIPALSATPGRIRFLGPSKVGADGTGVLRQLLGYSEERIAQIIVARVVEIEPSTDEQKAFSEGLAPSI